MKKLLEELWYEYQIEKASKRTDEEREIAERLMSSDDKLRSVLTDEQTILLEEYSRHLHDLLSVSSKDSFVVGVNFATRYLLEILCDNKNA